jgi:hypothetical protein
MNGYIKEYSPQPFPFPSKPDKKKQNQVRIYMPQRGLSNDFTFKSSGGSWSKYFLKSAANPPG